ncbi:MAG: hypothetical protein JNM89_03205 [Hyphomicrobiaceae bacterium]|nr:hypothetical protein [Hyphomicrobiaceae bacterium]
MQRRCPFQRQPFLALRRENQVLPLPAIAATVVLAGAIALHAAPARALEILPNEKAGREACEKRVCDIILKKTAGPPLVCNMTKTWDRDKIKKGSNKKRITWGFGDARCSLTLNLDRSLILPALTNDKYTLVFPPQTVNCLVEDEEKKAKPLVVIAAPKVKFKDGQAYKVWINVKEVEGEGLVKNLVWSVSKLADGIGIFHSDTVKSINTFVHKTCPDEHGKPVEAMAKPAAKGTAVKSEAAKSEAAKSEPGKPEPAKSEATKPAPSRQERATAN